MNSSSSPISSRGKSSGLELTSLKLKLTSPSPDHELLLRSFQAARLIPLLNSPFNLTLFAISDKAIQKKLDQEKGNGIWSFAVGTHQLLSTQERDNLQLELRDTLLYHILNYTIDHNSIPTTPLLLESLYFPTLTTAPLPTLPGSPSDPNPELPKGLLAGQGQRLRIASKGKQQFLGTDWKGEGGHRLDQSSFRNASNGNFIVVEAILEKPTNIATQIRANPDLSILTSLLPTKILNYLSDSKHITYFAPLNSAWSALSSLEMRYLESSFAEIDLAEIFGAEAASEGVVGYLDTLMGVNRTDIGMVTTILGQTLEVSTNKTGLATVNGTIIETADIFASNGEFLASSCRIVDIDSILGVIHTVPDLLLPSGSLALTAEKILIALNATQFVSLLRSVNLSHYVQHSASENAEPGFTILAPRNEVFNSKWGSLPELESILKYHLIAGTYSAEKLKDRMLLATELKTDKRMGASQVIPVSVSDNKGGIGLGFGGSSVIGEPVKVGNSIIYLLNSILEPPVAMLPTALLNLELSTFVASVYAAKLEKLFNLEPSTTFLIPSNAAFTTLGLTMNYLLLPSSKEELASVLKYHALEEIVYLKDFSHNSRTNRFPTLDGAEIYVQKGKGGVYIHSPTIGGIAVNGEVRDGKILEGDLLTETGVIHTIDQVELPPHISIDFIKLLKGAKAETMVNLIGVANMTWILDGSEPPVEHLGSLMKKKKQLVSGAYTLLVPSDKAFAKINITNYLLNQPALIELIQLHIIPTTTIDQITLDGKPINLVDEISYSTLLDSKYGQLAFRKTTEGNFVVGIKDARAAEGEAAEIKAWGRATPKINLKSGKLKSGGGILILDGVLIPYQAGFFYRNGWKFAGGAVIFSGIILIGLLVRQLWQRKKIMRYDQLEGEED